MRDEKRIRDRGTESARGQSVPAQGEGRPSSSAAPRSRRTGPTLAEPIMVDRWWKNRGGDAVYIRLSTFEGCNIVDLRTWRADAGGISRPGKGFACSVKHLPRLVQAFTRALEEARRAGLIADDEGEGAAE
ncbi:hypothetical protein [Bradyrhizobium sp. LTSP857]|uniref:hypothetical protein n=1 Tax=Bradyrhizobium sp. LTSP857 TaxID=1619231 RepID=UPI0012E08175|nr:hypothetical protein [Bradyrhizobium sp. LTSP857]